LGSSHGGSFYLNDCAADCVLYAPALLHPRFAGWFREGLAPSFNHRLDQLCAVLWRSNLAYVVNVDDSKALG